MPARIPLYDIAEEHRALSAELNRASTRVIASGRFVLGTELAAFEEELGRYLDDSFVVGVNSGTDALVLGLAALDIGPGDEVVTSPFSFFATAEAILRVGAAPVFADIEPETLCLSPAAVEVAVTNRTRAVLAVHVFGHCADLDRLQSLCAERRLLLVEDACQAIGAKWRGRALGTIGCCGALSFYPTKNLAALGDGGALVTRDPALAATVRLLRHHGRAASGRHARAGWNSRFDELQAAFLRAKLPNLDAALSRRRELADRYARALAPLLQLVGGHAGCQSSWHQFAVRTPRREALRERLRDAGIETGDYYPRPLYEEPALNGFRPAQPLPEVERACQEVLTLPLRPGLSVSHQDDVIAAVRQAMS